MPADLFSSTGLLAFLLSGGLFGIAVSAYRFYVNFRNTERGMARQRIKQANQNERIAQHEAGLWQNRAADLEYLLRRNGITIPPLPEEMKKFVSEIPADQAGGDTVDWKGIGPATPGSSGQ